MHTNNELSIEAYLDGELDAHGDGDMFAHLACCPDCRSYMRMVLAMRRSANEMIVDVPRSIDVVVLEAVDDHRGMQPVDKWYGLRVPIPLAAAVLLVAVGISVLAGQHLGARFEAKRWEREAAIYYQLPELVVVGHVDSKTENNGVAH